MDEEWGEIEFNEPYEGELINEINGVKLPEEYINFMRDHNGGEGDLGETWITIYALEELQQINDDYEVRDNLPGTVIFATGDGTEFYGVNKDGEYFNVPETFDPKDITILTDEFDELPEKINEFWR
ncbi:MAG: SMI1/KNR4 family protein [Eubacterium sp.]|nr:SMI1/KNR4 family protein [Eubacterium sp.]